MLWISSYWHPGDVTTSKSYDFALNLVRLTRNSALFLCPCLEKFPTKSWISTEIVEEILSTRFTMEKASSSRNESFVAPAGYRSNPFRQSFHKMHRDSHTVPQ